LQSLSQYFLFELGPDSKAASVSSAIFNGMSRLPYLLTMIKVTCGSSKRAPQTSAADAIFQMWDVVCHCTVSEILGSSNAHRAGRGGDWLHMRALLHTKCSDIVDACLTSANELGAAAAGNALWLLASLCEYVLIPICESDSCSCDRVHSGAKAKKSHIVDVAVSALSSTSSSPSSSLTTAAAAAAAAAETVQMAVSDKYIHTQIRCAHCCIKTITSAVSHICTAISAVARPTTIPIPNGDEAVLRDDDDYLCVR
jgi:hypothetical protein